MEDEFSSKPEEKKEAQNALLQQLADRLTILEAKSSNTDQRFDALEQSLTKLCTDVRDGMQQLTPLYQLAAELQQAKTAANANAGATNAQATTTSSATPMQQSVVDGGDMVDGSDEELDEECLAVPARQDIGSITGTCRSGGYGCGGGGSCSHSSELIDFAVDTAKVVGTVAAVGIAGYAAFKGGQWLIGKISDWSK